MSPERFLVTGGQGFLGTWIVKNLLELNYGVIAYDLHDQPARRSLLLPSERLKQVDFFLGDVNNLDLLKELIEKKSITHVIHLAALVTPDCKANPIKGAVVDVLGTLTVFEAVKAYKTQVRCISYASSAAVLGPVGKYESHPITDEAPTLPSTFYGVYKKTNENCARIYWEEEGIRSVGLRPAMVYGPGRERGWPDPTNAIKAALLGHKYEIGFAGKVNMLFVDDVAKKFISCVLKAPQGAPVFNMRGEVLDVKDMISHIEELVPSSKGEITYLNNKLSGATYVQDSGLQKLIGPFHPTKFREGIRFTTDFFRELLRENKLY